MFDRDIGQEDRKLFATDATHDVFLAQVPAQAVPDGGNTAVARSMPEAVVDGFEVVGID